MARLLRAGALSVYGALDLTAFVGEALDFTYLEDPFADLTPFDEVFLLGARGAPNLLLLLYLLHMLLFSASLGLS